MFSQHIPTMIGFTTYSDTAGVFRKNTSYPRTRHGGPITGWLYRHDWLVVTGTRIVVSQYSG